MIDIEYIAGALALLFALSGVGAGICAKASPRGRRADYVIMTVLLVAAATGSAYMSLTMGEWRTEYPLNEVLPRLISGGVGIAGVLSATLCYYKKHRVAGTFAVAGVFAAFYVNSIAEARTYLAPVPNQAECQWVSDADCANWNQSMAATCMSAATFCYYAAGAALIAAVVVYVVDRLRKANQKINLIFADGANKG